MHCRLRKCGVLQVCLIQCFSTSVQQYIQNVPISAVSEGESLDSPLDRLFGHILLANESTPEMKHRFIYCRISPLNVLGLELGRQNIQKHPDLVNSLGCRGGSVARLKHPKDQFKTISGHYKMRSVRVIGIHFSRRLLHLSLSSSLSFSICAAAYLWVRVCM